MFIIPTASPMRTSMPIDTTASLGASRCSNCGSVLHAFDGEIHVGDRFPGLPQILQDDPEEARPAAAARFP